MKALAPALAAVTALAAVAACGGRPPPPPRRVLERPVDAWSFRRYQQVVDVEVWVPDNRAVAHTASYARSSAEKRGQLGQDDVVNAFVTEYERPAGVLPAVVGFARRLAQESGYAVEERRLGGVRVIAVSGHGEAWALWGSGRYFVKIGGRGLSRVPPALVAAYAKPYPSGLREGMLEGPLEAPEREPETEPYDPDAPRPDWERGRERSRKR